MVSTRNKTDVQQKLPVNWITYIIIHSVPHSVYSPIIKQQVLSKRSLFRHSFIYPFWLLVHTYTYLPAHLHFPRYSVLNLSIFAPEPKGVLRLSSLACMPMTPRQHISPHGLSVLTIHPINTVYSPIDSYPSLLLSTHFFPPPTSYVKQSMLHRLFLSPSHKSESSTPIPISHHGL